MMNKTLIDKNELEDLRNAAEAGKTAATERDEAKRENTELQEKISGLETAAKEASKTNAELNDGLESALDTIEAKDKEIAGLNDENAKLKEAQSEFDAKVETAAAAKAAEIVAEAGHEPIPTKPANGNETGSLSEQLAAITEPKARAAFINKNQSGLMKEQRAAYKK